MQLPLAYYGDPILRKKTTQIKEINDEIRELVVNMTDTMRANDGIGLAAPQIHCSIALFITEVPIVDADDPEKWEAGPLRVFINPKIISYSEEKWDRGEGCLSIPGIYGEVLRPVRITVQAMDLTGEVFEEEFTWLAARAVMHENDHINGTLFIDRLSSQERKSLEHKLHEVKKRYSKHH